MSIMTHGLVTQVARIADALETLIKMMSGEALRDAAGESLPQFNRDGPTRTMSHGGEQYVREPLPGDRWVLYKIGADGNVYDLTVELANGERIPIKEDVS